MTRKYPLDPLKRVRAEKVDQGARALAHALGEAEKARLERERRELAKLELEQSLSESARAEREKLEKGGQRVADLAREAAFGIASDMRRAAHQRSVEEARLGHARAVSEAEAKRMGLASARADAEVVEKHHSKWHKAGLLEVAAREDEDAEEVHLAHRNGRGGA